MLDVCTIMARADDHQVGGDHYSRLDITPWEYMEVVLTPEEFRGYLKGNVIKYLSRSKNPEEDMRKAEHYARKLVEVLDKQKAPAAIPKPVGPPNQIFGPSSGWATSDGPSYNYVPGGIAE